MMQLYEAFVSDPDLPRSIYEVENADRCAIEFCSFSKTAGFTGTRCGWTIVPDALIFDGVRLNQLWRVGKPLSSTVSLILYSVVRPPYFQKKGSVKSKRISTCIVEMHGSSPKHLQNVVYGLPVEKTRLTFGWRAPDGMDFLGFF